MNTGEGLDRMMERQARAVAGGEQSDPALSRIEDNLRGLGNHTYRLRRRLADLQCRLFGTSNEACGPERTHDPEAPQDAPQSPRAVAASKLGEINERIQDLESDLANIDVIAGQLEQL